MSRSYLHHIETPPRPSYWAKTINISRQQKEVLDRFKRAIDERNWDKILHTLIDEANHITLGYAGGYYKDTMGLAAKPFGRKQDGNTEQKKQVAREFFLQKKEEPVEEKKEDEKKKEEVPEEEEEDDMNLVGDTALEEDKDAEFIVSMPSFLQGEEKYPEAKENPEAGYALSEAHLPAELMAIVQRVIDKHKDEKIFQEEWLEPIKKWFRSRGLRYSKLKNDEIVEEEEEKKGSLKDQTVMVYTSRIRAILLRQDIWHGPEYENNLREIEEKGSPAVKEGLEDWLKLPPAIKIRKWYQVKKMRDLRNPMSPWEKKLVDMDVIPKALRNFTADSIFQNITGRVLTYRKQRLEERLQKTVLIITKPEIVLRDVFAAFFNNDNNGQKLYCALLLASGRRPKDIYKKGCFMALEPTPEDPVPTFDRYECYAYSGLKPGLHIFKRGDVIPLLVPFGIFRNGLRRFRKMWGHIQERQITTREYNKKAYDSVFLPLQEQGIIKFNEDSEPFHLGSREFRAMYARYSVAIFGANRNYNLWIKSVLMHSNVNTSLNYTRIVFPEDNMQRMQPWVVNAPKGSVIKLLNEKLREAKFLGNKRSQPFREDHLTRKCLGMTLDEALAETDNETVKEIIRRYWRGEDPTDEEKKDLEVDMAEQEDREEMANEPEGEEEEEEPKEDDDDATTESD
jgi:hypothetical protein